MARIELALTCTFAGCKLNTCHRHNRVERKVCSYNPTCQPPHLRKYTVLCHQGTEAVTVEGFM